MGGEWGQGVPIRGAPGRFARETQAVLVMRTTGKGKEERQVGHGASHLSYASLAHEARREDIWVLCRRPLWFREFPEGPSGDGGLCGHLGPERSPAGTADTCAPGSLMSASG